jgi:maleylpyruvate isomerase
MILHSYYRSSASFRVRIALNLKGLDYDPVFVHLRNGAQHGDEFLSLNPHGLIPVLVDGDTVLTQSLAILEYLDEVYRDPPFLPEMPADRAYVRSLAQAVACDIHPIDNLRVLKYLRRDFGADEPAIGRWYNHWIATGFSGIEATLAGDPRTGAFCFGDRPGLADILLVPQVVNAGNYNLAMTPFPTIQRIFDACMALPAFAEAHPSRQPDAE